MTMLGLSPRDRRVLASGIIAISSIAGIGRGLPAARAWNAMLVGSAASVANEVASGRVARRGLEVTRAALSSARRRSAEVDSSILIAPSPSAGAALLASLVADAADSSRVKILATQLHADSAASGSLARLSVRITAVGDVAGLVTFLRTIESGDVVLAVEELAISPSDPAGSDDKPEALRLELVVAGLARAPINKL